MSLRLPIDTLFHRSSQDTNRAFADKISISRETYHGKLKGYRTWTVRVAINDAQSFPRTLTDPYTDDDYQSHAKSRSGMLLDEEQSSKNYFIDLVRQLGIQDILCRGWPQRQISIHDEFDEIVEHAYDTTSERSIYSLFWEVLENVEFWRPCRLTRVRLCRTWTFNAVEASSVLKQVQRTFSVPGQRAEWRILLVIARSFRRDRDQRYRDYRPSLILGPLLKIASLCNRHGHLPRVHLHVLRPGTIGELESELRKSETPYDIVHLDMHGKLKASLSSMSPPSIVVTPYLLFAKHYREGLRWFRNHEDPVAELLGDDDSLSDVQVHQVAKLLKKYRIRKVALSACLSSYAQRNMLANMCHIFLSHGAWHVSAMSFQVLEKTAQIYYAAFYEQLLVKGHSFLSAATLGREALRAEPGQSANALVPTSYHIASRVSTNDFWPGHGLETTWVRIIAGYCLRITPIMWFVYAFLSRCTLASWTATLWECLFTMSCTILIWYGSVRWVQGLTCPLWFWTPSPHQIFDLRDKLDPHSVVDIEHLVLEDRLEFEANQGAIYLWNGDPKATLGSMISEIAHVWVWTGFVDFVDVIPAIVFTSWLSGLQWWLRLRVTRHKSTLAGRFGSNQRRLLVITEFDEFYEVYRQRNLASRAWDVSDADLPDLQDALWRMAGFVSSYEIKSNEPDILQTPVSATNNDTVPPDEALVNDTVCGKTYLIVTGSLHEDQWRKLPWVKFEPEITQLIGRAVPHLHNITSS